MASPEPTLMAEDAEDLEVISARLQDAVTVVKDLVFLPRARRFAGVFNRFKWEAAEAKNGHNVRVRAGLHFDNVKSVKSFNINRSNPDGVISLLAITFTPAGADDPGGVIELVFAGGGAIKLEVEAIAAELSDAGMEWAARGRPRHEDGS